MFKNKLFQISKTKKEFFKVQGRKLNSMQSLETKTIVQIYLFIFFFMGFKTKVPLNSPSQDFHKMKPTF
jgi:hypothetical protein